MSSNKGWLHSDIYDNPGTGASPRARTSILKFGSLQGLLTNAGKLLGQYLMYLFLFAFLRLLLIDPAMRHEDQYYFAAQEIVKLFCITVSVFLAVKVLDDSDLASLGLKLDRAALKDFLVGVGLMLILNGAEFLVLVGTGALKIVGVAWAALPPATVFWSNLGTLVGVLLLGWSEELASRGFHLRIISRGLNRPLGVILSSAMFAYMHHDNPEFGTGYAIFVFLFGITMSLAFLQSGSLWLAIGLHAGWDFFTAELWGGAISGLRLAHLLDVRLTGYAPLLMFGLDLASLLMLAIAVRLYTRRRRLEVSDW
jgi:hypothetical protein